MSKFFKALEQAQRDRALRAASDPAPPSDRATASSQPGPHTGAAPPPRFAGPARIDDGSAAGLDEHLVSLVTPAAFESEQYRSLRLTVEHLRLTSGLKVVAVSSPSTGDGKTLTAVNLAGSLAQSPATRVLLIDADLRRPALGRLLGLGKTPGLVGAIVDPRLELEQVVEPRPPFNLSVLCAGQTPPSPYEVLKSPRLGELLDAARSQYDFIIVDTPPLTPIQDCRVIGHWVDGFLLVIAAHRTPRRLAEESLTTLDPAKVLGIVFNQDDRSEGHHYSGYYGNAPAVEPPAAAPTLGPLGRAARALSQSFRPLRGSRWPRERR